MTFILQLNASTNASLLATNYAFYVIWTKKWLKCQAITTLVLIPYKKKDNFVTVFTLNAKIFDHIYGKNNEILYEFETFINRKFNSLSLKSKVHKTIHSFCHLW